jgi:hypothetical protein
MSLSSLASFSSFSNIIPKVQNVLSAEQVVSSWTLIRRIAVFSNMWTSVCWSPQLEMFVAVSNSGTSNGVMTSNNGIDWTIRTTNNNQWQSVCWSPELGIFVAVSNSGTSNRVMTSNNGINWTIRTSIPNNNWRSVCWSPELGIFVAVSDSGTSNRVMTSPDGINWTLRTSIPNNEWISVCWGPQAPNGLGGTGLFVAVSYSGTSNRVMTSPDGINWTLRTSIPNNGWSSVCWGPQAPNGLGGTGLFVAVSLDGTSNRVMTSPNGINWTLRTSIPNNEWSSVCWSSELKIFVAVSLHGTIGNKVMTSPNGINWTLRTTPDDDDYRWGSVCWSPKLGLFVAVLLLGPDDRVMTSLSMFPV